MHHQQTYTTRMKERPIQDKNLQKESDLWPHTKEVSNIGYGWKLIS